jgi:hypothetical protein
VPEGYDDSADWLLLLQDPFVALKSNTNAAGTFLSQEEKNVMRLELAVALAHTIQTLDILSTSD